MIQYKKEKNILSLNKVDGNVIISHEDIST